MRTLKLMADYQCFPLWEASPGKVGNIDPNSLPISTSLREKLMEWADLYDSVLNWENPACSGFYGAAEEEAFNAQGMSLAHHLREELGGGFKVVLQLNASVKPNRS